MTQLRVKYPAATTRIICNFLNKPDVGKLRWETQPNQGLPGMRDMYLKTRGAVSMPAFCCNAHALIVTSLCAVG